MAGLFDNFTLSGLRGGIMGGVPAVAPPAPSNPDQNWQFGGLLGLLQGGGSPERMQGLQNTMLALAGAPSLAVANQQNQMQQQYLRAMMQGGQEASNLIGGQSVPTMPQATASTEPRGIRNNNPLNIESGSFAKEQPGYAGSDGRFAQFASPQHGIAAASNLLDTYNDKYGLNTVAGIVGRWAPSTDKNPTGVYVDAVAKSLGVDPNQPLDVKNPAVKQALIGAMGQFENGKPIQMTQVAPPTTAGTAVAPPAASSVQAQIDQLQKFLASPRAAFLNPNAAKAIEMRITDLQKSIEPTPASREAAALGLTTPQLEAAKEQAKLGPEVQKQAIGSLTKRIDDSFEKATAAADALRSSNDLRAQLDAKSGIFTGQFATNKLALAKFMEFLGKPVDPRVINTETFKSVVGQQVASLVKNFGSGTSITNQDREYAEKMAAGDINLDEGSIRRVFDILDKLNMGRLDRHNALVDRVAKSTPAAADIFSNYKVDIPEKYTPPASAMQPSAVQAQTTPAAAIPAPAERIAGQVYTTPKGPARWMGSGWQLVQ